MKGFLSSCGLHKHIQSFPRKKQSQKENESERERSDTKYVAGGYQQMKKQKKTKKEKETGKEEKRGDAFGVFF